MCGGGGGGAPTLSLGTHCKINFRSCGCKRRIKCTEIGGKGKGGGGGAVTDTLIGRRGLLSEDLYKKHKKTTNTELMVDIYYYKSLVRAIGKVFPMKLI